MDRKQLQIKQVSPDGSGLARIATLNVVDKDGDVTRPGAFGSQVAKLLPAHNWSSVWLGKARLFEHSSEVLADFQFNLDIPTAREWHSALKFDLNNGTPISEWSYGFSILKSSEGEFQGRPVRFLEALKVHEVSPVVVGAGIDTTTLSVKHHAPGQTEHAKFQATCRRLNSAGQQQLPPVSQFAQAKAILDQVGARRSIEQKGEIPCVHEPAPSWLLQIGRQICDELKVFMPSLYMSRPARWNEKHTIAMPRCSGQYRWPAGIVYVQADLPRKEQVITLAHELHHHWTHEKDLPSSEYAAEAFGQSIARRYEL